MYWLLYLYYYFKYDFIKDLFIVSMRLMFCIPTGIMLALAIFELYSKFYYINTSFINIIAANQDQTFQVEQVLDDFNLLGYNKVVFKSGSRPINIVVGRIDRDYAIGWARVKPGYCDIKIDDRLSPEDFQQTVVHELLHCYGYEHVKDETSVMNPSVSDKLSRDSIRNYAKDVLKARL